MKSTLPLIAMLLAFFLFSGCTMPWDAQAQPPAAPQITPPALPQYVAPPAQPMPEPNNSAAQNQTAPPTQNGTSAPVDIFANITPRNISDNIGDGQFRIVDMPGESLNIYAINDGFADSILVQKGSFYMLVDSGDSAYTQEFLDSKNITRLNVVVATRDDAGAIGGLSDIINSYQVDEFWDNNVPGTSADYASLLSLVQAKGITTKHPQAGDRLTVQGLKIDILNPQKARLLGNPDTDAIVMKLSNNAFCALLLNPTVQERENALIETGKDLRCDVVTCFKHGEARPDSSLLINSYAQPRDAIISVGPNLLGLPSTSTLAWLALKNITIWRTDNSTIAVSTDGLGSYDIGAYDENSSAMVSPVAR